MRFTTEAFEGKRALITGGLGFVGSSLALRLVELGAHVTIMDCMLPGHGANLFNIAPVRDRVTVTYSDIRDANLMGYLVQGQDYLFHLAGQVDHITSLTDPYPDIDINIRGTATVMEACRQHNPQIKVIYTGTRGEYGTVPHLPVSEETPTTPKMLLDISNLTAEKIILMYHQVHGVQSILLRLTNLYGARAQMHHPRYGVVNWFVRQAIDDETIKVFGDGTILRDFLYIEDCIDAILMCVLCDAAFGEIFNVATGEPCNFRILAETLIAVAGSGLWTFAPFTLERAAQEPGDFYADISKIKRLVEWQPITTLYNGLKETVAYYRIHKAHYW